MISFKEKQRQQQQPQLFGGGNQQQQQIFDINVPQTQPGVYKYASEPCRNPECNMFGRPDQNRLCSKCFKLNKTERD